jgi:hypothetical protein
MFSKTYDLSTRVAIARGVANDCGVSALTHRLAPSGLWRDLAKDWSRWSKSERMAAVVVAGTPLLMLFAGSIHALGVTHL